MVDAPRAKAENGADEGAPDPDASGPGAPDPGAPGAGQPAAATPNPTPHRTIGEHGVIGDLKTCALVARDGAIDYLCWPNLDSPTVFAALLDPDRGGCFTLTPDLPGARVFQAYKGDTKVLTTRWVNDDAGALVTDFMPHPDAKGVLHHRLIRQVTVTRGEVRFEVACGPRFDYARIVPTARAVDGGVVFEAEGQGGLVLHASFPLSAEGADARGSFVLRKGETAWLALADAGADRPDEAELQRALDRTAAVWQRWADRSLYKGRWREQVIRSALTLKLLTSCEHGSIAAAATFGLPEATGEGRNWDYRATWIRDASFTVYALMRLGYVEEAEGFRQWVAKRVEAAHGDGDLRIMYAIDGGEALEEQELPHFAGYAYSRPVRIGNGARTQTQLDIYGELMDSIYLGNKYGSAISHRGWGYVRHVVEHVRKHWREPDEGIWEIRGDPREFTHSRVMCWVAIDRAIRLAEKRSLPAPLGEWNMARTRIADDIWANFRHPEKGYFVQSKGGTDLDASLLMMPLMRFVSATDPVWLATLDAIGEELTDDGLVFRYRNADGLTGGDGAFTTCTFWYVECLARAGRLDEARRIMDRGIGYANELGLFSEEVDLKAAPLGNFPQALTHLAFISAAYFLDRKLSGAREVWQP